MRRANLTKPAFLAALAAISLAAPAVAGDVHGGVLTVSHAWSRPTPPGAPTAAGYLTVTNHGAAPDRLLSAESPAAASLTLHLMSDTGGIMRMRAVPEGAAIAPGATLSLDPNGYHLMFEGLKAPFKAADHVPAVLHFAHAGAVRISFEVGDGGKSAPMAGMQMH